MDLNEFDNDKSIEPGQLDVEIVRQPDLFFKWAERAVAARKEMDRAKLALDILEAKLDSQCRDNPETFGLQRVTESAVSLAIKKSKRYKDAYHAYIDARHTAALLDKAVEAMEQKKRMLEILVTLHGQQYFAGPSVPRDLVGEFQRHREAISKRTNERQLKKVRRVRKGRRADG